MADSNTETAAPASDGTSTDHGSEFSKPTGAKDSDVWEKHFGGSKESKAPKAKATSDRASTRESPKPSESKTSTASSKTTDGDKPSEKASSKKPSDAPAPSKPKESKSPKTPAESEATGQKTAETDPEAPSKKARDFYEQAKKTEEPREARKLYKRALQEAFGEVPEEFNDKRYADVRKERAAANAAIDEKAKKNDARFTEAVGKLKPAIYVMRQLEGSGLADKLTVPMVERTVHVMRALKSLEDGDFTQLAEVVARASGVDHDEAMKRFVRGVKVSPEGKAARQAAEQAQRDNATLKERLQALERQLTEKDTKQTEAQKRQEQERRTETARAQWLDDIETELDGHPVLQLKDEKGNLTGAKRVLRYLIKTAHPTLRTPRFSKQDAADRVVAHERKRLQGARHLLDDGEAPAAPVTQTRRIGSVSRAETADAGVLPDDPEARFGHFFDKHNNAAAGGQRRRR